MVMVVGVSIAVLAFWRSRHSNRVLYLDGDRLPGAMSHGCVRASVMRQRQNFTPVAVHITAEGGRRSMAYFTSMIMYHRCLLSISVTSDFYEVEQTLRDILHGDGTWGSGLSNGSSSSADQSERSSDVSSINGKPVRRPRAARSPNGNGDPTSGGDRGAHNVVDDRLTETRTLV